MVMATPQAAPEQLLTPAQVAAIVFVDPKTVSRWARAGKIPSMRTPGGHRRFRSCDVEALMRADHGPEQRQVTPVRPLSGATLSRGDPDAAGAAGDVARAAADAMITEAVAIALEAQADAAAEAVTERAAAVVAAAAIAAAAASRARDARAVAAAEAALAQDLARSDSVAAPPRSILSVAR